MDLLVSIAREARRRAPDMVLQLAAAWATLYMMKRFLENMHSKESAEGTQHLKQFLKKRKNTKIRNAVFTNHELSVASDIILPEFISISFDDIGGLEEVKSQLNESIIWPLRYPNLYSNNQINNSMLSSLPKGVLLYGSPGTGKTMLAKAIAKSCQAAFINVDISMIMDKFLGESEKMMSAVFSLALKLQPAIIFIDEIDSLFGKRGVTLDAHMPRVITTFLSSWDGILTSTAQVTVIGATNRPHAIDEAILRRMPQRYHVPVPDLRSREKILTVLLKQVELDSSFSISELAAETEGYTGSDLQALCSHAIKAPIKDHIQTNQKPGQKETVKFRAVTLADFRLSMKHVTASLNFVASNSLSQSIPWSLTHLSQSQSQPQLQPQSQLPSHSESQTGRPAVNIIFTPFLFQSSASVSAVSTHPSPSSSQQLQSEDSSQTQGTASNNSTSPWAPD